METKKSKPSSKHQLLETFVGNWNTEGNTIADQDSPELMIKAKDKYEWLPGKFFLVHHIEAQIGEEETKGIEIIGYDSSKNSYFTHHFDSEGNCTAFQMSLQEGIIKITGERERFSGNFSANGDTITGYWERRSADSNWKHAMNVKLVKIK